MSSKWIIDDDTLVRIREQKEEDRRAHDLPPPSVEAKEEQFCKKLLKAQLANALAMLAADDRELVELVFGTGPDGEQQTITEIAKTRGCARSTLYGRLTASLLTLRDICTSTKNDAEQPEPGTPSTSLPAQTRKQ